MLSHINWSNSRWEVTILDWPKFISTRSDRFSEIIQILLTSHDPLSQVVKKLFSTTKIIYTSGSPFYKFLPGTHTIGWSYTPWKLTIFPFLYHATSSDNPDEVIRLTISKLMQEYAHILQWYIYKSHGYYLRYVRDFLRCHIEPLQYGQLGIANIKSSYMNTDYFEGEAHHQREPFGHLIFILTYIHHVTWQSRPPLQDLNAINAYINPSSHPDIAPEYAYMLAQFFNDFFDEFQWREQLSKNQIITRSTHLSDYPLAKARQAKSQELWENLTIPNITHIHGISVKDILQFSQQ